ncbi:MAG TPA: secretin N-terminal domain-containing protein [Steroidobacteraceae bacterium]|nr:secretin N-terminal domain-containing protein [Steroidobacteraceae bacterium]
MTTRTRMSIIAAVALLTLVAAPCGSAQVERSDDKSPPALAGAVPLERVIAAVAKRTGKKFIVDPRLRGDATVVGQDPANVDYPTLLLILRIHGFAAMEQGGYVQIIPDANIRQYPVPVATGKESYADGEFVNKVIVLKNAPTMQLVPILRPMLPQSAHLVAMPCKNTLLIVDTFANVKRIEQLARSFDVGDAYVPPSCSQEWPPK